MGIPSQRSRDRLQGRSCHLVFSAGQIDRDMKIAAFVLYLSVFLFYPIFLFKEIIRRFMNFIINVEGFNQSCRSLIGVI